MGNYNLAALNIIELEAALSFWTVLLSCSIRVRLMLISKSGAHLDGFGGAGA